MVRERAWIAAAVVCLVFVGCGGATSAGSGTDGGSDAANDANDTNPQGVATFSFVVNGVVMSPMTCPSEHWEYPWPAGEGAVSPEPPAPGITSVFIVNTGTLPLAYFAQALWAFGSHYVPGVSSGPNDLAGVLAPGAQIDITSVYLSGTVALLGSAEPFSDADASYASDEGTIPWPKGVSGSGGASTMNIAEIEVPSSPPSTCRAATQAW